MDLEFIQQNILYVAMAAISGSLFLFLTFRRPDAKYMIDAARATQLINREDAAIVDVREMSEYVEGHLPQARSIPLGQLEQRLGDLEKRKDAPVILVCQSGSRSTEAGKKLTGLGFSRVYVLEGGVAAWRSAGMPLKKGSKK